MNHQEKLSVIVLSYNSSARLDKAVTDIIQRLVAENIPYEIIIVDDGSSDDSVEKANHLATLNNHIVVCPLAKNYSSPMAQFAGLSVCTGACAAPMPDDGQRPLDHLIELYRIWQQGHKIAIGYRNKRSDGWFSDALSGLYYRIMNATTPFRFPPLGTDGYLIDREIINLLNALGSKRNTTPVLEILQLGYHPVWLPYSRPEADHKSRWTMAKKLKLAGDTFFGSTNWPLRMITWLGFLTFAVSFLLSVAILLAKIFSDNTLFGLPIQGWATTVILITTFNGLIMLCIGILAQYLWRIFEEVKGRPSFIIKKDRHNG